MVKLLKEKNMTQKELAKKADVTEAAISQYINGKRNSRTIYEFFYNGKKQRVAVQIGSNGYIVSANPKSMKG